MLNRIVTHPDPYEPYLLSQAIRTGDLLGSVHRTDPDIR